MKELFSPEWMQIYAQKWNAEPELTDALSKIHFSSVREQRDFVRSGKKVRSLKLSFLYEVILFAINISNCTINHLDEISQKDC